MSAVCPHRPPCPGCPRLGEDAPPPAKSAALDELARRTGATLEPLLAGPAEGWRMRARLAVRGRLGSPKIGLFQEGSHRIVDVPRCPVHHPAINAAAGAVRRAMRVAGVEPYFESAHRGLVRYLQAAVEEESGRVQLVLVTNDVAPDALGPVVDVLVRETGASLNGLWWNGNPGRGNAILGPHWRLLHGESWLHGRSGTARLFVHPGAFAQANPTLAEAMFASAREQVPAGARVLELYAGSGAFGLGLVARGEAVVFNELSPHAVAGLRRGLDALGVDAEVLEGPAAAAATRIAASDVVVADPPRKGLDEDVLRALIDAPPARLILVACGFEAFLRDVERLLGSGRFALATLRPVALFPWTDHLEVQALFTAT